MSEPGDSRARPARHAAVVDVLEQVAADVVEVRFTGRDGSLPSWAPGAHIDLELLPGLVRQYSLCGPAREDGTWTVAVRLEPGGIASTHIHRELALGEEVRVAGPKAMFDLADADHHTLIAGGIGITPVLTMAEALRAEGRPFTLVYVGRDRTRMAYLDRVLALAEQEPDGVTIRVVDRAVDSSFTLEEAILPLPPGSMVHACGPERMLADLRRLIPDDRLVVESFAPTDPADDALKSAGAFEVQVGPGGPVHQVPAGCSMLDVLLAAGVDLMWSCREGTCASCEVGVLEGEPEHRDSVLTEDERAAGDTMFPCVSRARTARIVIDA